MVGTPRSELSAGEVESLLATLEDRLSRLKLATQPPVAARLIALMDDPDAGVSDFARVIRSDAALCGRLLKVVNSAVFGQRSPVTQIERACVILGLQRLRSVALGFYLSNSMPEPDAELSRRVWGESVYRACLAATLAPRCGGGAGGEAFVVGLMLDAGVPLMPRLIGPEYHDLHASAGCPSRLYSLEFERLPFTHADVATALCRCWSLPDALSRPISWHHTRPTAAVGADLLQRLQRISYYVGSVDLSEESLPKQRAPLSDLARRTLGVDSADLEDAVRRAQHEYSAVRGVFCDVATDLGDLEAISERAHQHLVRANEEIARLSLTVEQAQMPVRLELAGLSVELQREQDGQGVAYLCDSQGQRIVSYRFRLGRDPSCEILDALGISTPSKEWLLRLDGALADLYHAA